MKKFLFAGSLCVAIAVASAAGAADLTPMYKAHAPAPAGSSWTGCYLGAHLGWGLADPQLQDSSPVNVLTAGGVAVSGLLDAASLQRHVGIGDDNGPLAGAQIGCDYQFSGNYVIGISASAAGADINGDTLDPFQTAGPSNDVLAKTDFLGDVSGRLGVIWGQFLLYGKGGVAFAHNTYTVDCGCAFDGSPPFRASNTATGALAGAGIEWAFASDWSAFVEYNHYFFDSQTLNFNAAYSFAGPVHAAVNVSQSVDAAKVGVNFHFH